MPNSRRLRSALLSLVAGISVSAIAGCSAEPIGSDTKSRDDEGAEGADGPGGSDGQDDDSDSPETGTGDQSGSKPDAGKGAPRADAGKGTQALDAGGGAKNGAPDAAAPDSSQGRQDAGGAQGRADSSTGPADDDPLGAGCDVSPITDEMRKSYREMSNAYYTKYASANGVVVATGAQVDDVAVGRYCRLLVEMFSNADVRQSIVSEKMWFTMISENEQLSSLPQISKAYGTSLNARARGLGGLTPTICAEDSIMCMKGDKWAGDCICPHETGHTMYSSGIAKVPALSSRLTAITKSTRDSGRIANSYVWQDGNESGMMAWGVQVWYDCAINGTKGAYHPDINTRAELQKELPEFYEFLADILPQDRKYEDCYSNP